MTFYIAMHTAWALGFCLGIRLARGFHGIGRGTFFLHSQLALLGFCLTLSMIVDLAPGPFIYVSIPVILALGYLFGASSRARLNDTGYSWQFLGMSAFLPVLALPLIAIRGQGGARLEPVSRFLSGYRSVFLGLAVLTACLTTLVETGMKQLRHDLGDALVQAAQKDGANAGFDGTRLTVEVAIPDHELIDDQWRTRNLLQICSEARTAIMFGMEITFQVLNERGSRIGSLDVNQAACLDNAKGNDFPAW